MNKVSGIYQIQSKIHPEKIYIGSAVDIQERWRIHLRGLRNNKHHSKKLQRHFNKYGEQDLQLSLVLECDKEVLINAEQAFINHYDPYFNICRVAGSQLGIKRSDEFKRKCSKYHSGKTLSEEHKEHIRESCIGINNWTKGISRSNNVRTQIAIGMLGKQNTLGKHWNLSEEAKQNMRKGWIKRKLKISA